MPANRAHGALPQKRSLTGMAWAATLPQKRPQSVGWVKPINFHGFHPSYDL
ncbi:hypothetical protein FB481_111183 [Pseudomonas sp. AG1028]|nr:hypothetical protein FB481_111183 [Pseudomonas sp. AG1028]